MFKKEYTMNTKNTRRYFEPTQALDLTTAVEQFVAQGGVINKIPIGKPFTAQAEPITCEVIPADAQGEKTEKLELLKALIAKGAGFSSLQYCLKMNRKDIKQLAVEHGIKISFNKPLNPLQKNDNQDTSDIDDAVAGHAMHYSSLGYSALEIANILGLTVRQVWRIGKAYRFEFKQSKDDVTR